MIFKVFFPLLESIYHKHNETAKNSPLGEKRETMSKVELWEQKHKKKMTKSPNILKKSKKLMLS